MSKSCPLPPDSHRLGILARCGHDLRPYLAPTVGGTLRARDAESKWIEPWQKHRARTERPIAPSLSESAAAGRMVKKWLAQPIQMEDLGCSSSTITRWFDPGSDH